MSLDGESNRPPQVNEFAPLFTGATTANPKFRFSSLGGCWIVLLLFGSLSAPAAAAAHAAVLADRALFDDHRAYFFGVTIDPADRAQRGLKDQYPGIRYFWDTDTAISRRYGAASEGVYDMRAVLIDPQMRVAAIEPLANIGAIMGRLRSELSRFPEAAEGGHAPVLTIPRVFEPQLCRALIAYYERIGGEASGFMREEGGKTVAIQDASVKRRTDVTIEDQALIDATRDRLSYRLIPAIHRFLGWRATRVERYIVARYGAEDSGFFRSHRDNTTPGTAHRKFACTINLNAEEYEGGELRFPEFGSRTYKPPTGGATVFCCSLLHEATPVLRGQRYAFLPFLYDEAGRQVRNQNAHTLRPGSAEEAT